MGTNAHPILNESVCTLAEAAMSLPAIGGRPISTKTVYAWKDRGVMVGDRRVKLEVCRLGGRVVTSTEAVSRFLSATSEPSTGAIPRTPVTRRKSSDAALAFMDDEFKKAV